MIGALKLSGLQRNVVSGEWRLTCIDQLSADPLIINIRAGQPIT
jgi:hypothetical protein